MKKKLARLEDILRAIGSVVVAYSGGVDSTFLAATAARVLGSRALAVTATSPTYPAQEAEAAQALARRLGIRHRLIPTEELGDPCFVANSPQRCYFCKSELFQRLRQIAREEGLQWVVDGTNTDDLADYRPGRQAALEREVRSPLLEAGLTKAEIRSLSRELGLPTWDKPALACLASRFPYGTPITAELLCQVGEAEEFLCCLGAKQVRVRHHGAIARIEVDEGSLPLLLEKRKEVVAHLRCLGYTYVALDLAGYRTGSLNEMLETGRLEPSP